MGYKGPESRDIKVEITNRRANQQILDAYIPDAADRRELEAKYTHMEANMLREQEEVRRDTRGALTDLRRQIIDQHNENIYNFSLEYGNLITGKITLDDMNRRLDDVIAKMQGGRQMASLNMDDASIVLPVQIALNRAGKTTKVDGVMRVGGETENMVKAFQQEKGLPVTGKLDQKTLERLTKYLSPTWQAEAEQKKEAANEQEIMMDEPADKLQKAGDAMFNQGDWLQAMRFYRGAASQAAKYDMKPGQTENPVYAYVANKFLKEANLILDEAKASSGTNDYKRNEMARAKNLLSLIQNVDSNAINKLLIDARREEDKGVHTFEADKRQLEGAKGELARINENIALGEHGKIKQPETRDENGLPIRDEVPVRPEKLPVWTKQKAIWEQKVADAQKVVDGYDKRITLDATLTGAQLLEAYIRSYVGPLLPDVAPPPRSEDTYIPAPRPIEARPEPSVSSRTVQVDVRSNRPETINRHLISIPYEQYLPQNIHEQAAAASDFLNTHLTRDYQDIRNAIWNMPNRVTMTYVVKNANETMESIANNAGVTVGVVRAKLAGRTLGVDTILTFEPTEVDQHMRAYKAYLTIAEPYLNMQAATHGHNIPSSQLLQQFRAYAQHHPIQVEGRTYYLNFER